MKKSMFLPIANMRAHFHLSEEQIEAGKENTLNKVKRRVNILRGGSPFPDLKGRPVLRVDDGLASGFTFMVAAESVKKAGAASITVAVPTGHMESIYTIIGQVDAVCCPNIRSGISFAVADAYKQWSDVTEAELLNLLKKGRDHAL